MMSKIYQRTFTKTQPLRIKREIVAAVQLRIAVAKKESVNLPREEKVQLMISLDKGPCGQCHIILLKQMKIDFIYRLNYEEINRSADDHYGRFTNCHRK